MKYILLIISFVLLCNCASRSKIDGAIFADESEFNGFYSGTAGVSSSSSMGLPSASTFRLITCGLFDEDIEAKNENDVSISVNNGTLEVSCGDKIKEIRYKYNNGRIEIDPNSKFMTFLIISGYRERAITISMDGNKDLIVEDSKTGTGFFLVFPQAMSFHDVYTVKRK